MRNTCTDLDAFKAGLHKRNPGQPGFQVAVQEVASDVLPFIGDNPGFQDECLLERFTEPERVHSFRIRWDHDKVDKRLHDIMRDIHSKCRTFGETAAGRPYYVRGANIGGFIKVANALKERVEV